MKVRFTETYKVATNFRFGSDSHIHRSEKIKFSNGWYGESSKEIDFIHGHISFKT